MSTGKYFSKTFDFNKFWSDFNSAACGMWDEIAIKLLGGTAREAAQHPNKVVDCPFPAAHGESKGIKKMRVKASFAGDGMYFCSCGHKSVLDMAVESGQFRTKFDAAVEVINAFKLNVKLPATKMKPKGLTKEEEAEREAARQAKIREREKAEAESHVKWHGFIKNLWERDLHKGLTRPAELYLKRRSLPVELIANPAAEDVRFGVSQFRGETLKQRMPLMGTLLRCQKTLKPVAVQRTFFTESGVRLKHAFGEMNDKMCTKILGSVWPVCTVVRKLLDHDTVHVGEGFETIAAVGGCIADGAVVSTMNDDGLAQYTVPSIWEDRVNTICLWADHDLESQAGYHAALKAAMRLQTEGYKVVVLYPNYGTESVDWQAIVQKEGLLNLPMELRKKALLKFASITIFEPLAINREEDDHDKQDHFSIAV